MPFVHYIRKTPVGNVLKVVKFVLCWRTRQNNSITNTRERRSFLVLLFKEIQITLHLDQSITGPDNSPLLVATFFSVLSPWANTSEIVLKPGHTPRLIHFEIAWVVWNFLKKDISGMFVVFIYKNSFSDIFELVAPKDRSANLARV